MYLLEEIESKDRESVVQFLRKVSDSEQKQKEQLIQKINCSECDSFQLYQGADF